mgnify:FL=1
MARRMKADECARRWKAGERARKGKAALRRRGPPGSFTLEAALALPLFLLVILFFILLIRTAVISMALHGALSQSVRLAAAVWQPVGAARDNGMPSAGPSRTEWSDVGETLRELGDVLPEPFGEWARRAADGGWRPDQLAARMAFKSLALRFAGPETLDPSRLEIVEVRLPSAQDPEEGFLAVQASYRLPFRVPLLNRPLEIRESAAERAWVGGKPLLPNRDDRQNDPGQLAFVSLEPDPVRPGKKATLTLQARPGEAVHLTVIYKSGPSQAKNLGTAVADENGRVVWVWHVSGRTTPGEWHWEAVASDGSVLRRNFTVAGKADGK